MSDTHDSASGAPVTPQRLMQYSFAYAAPFMMMAAVENHVFDVLDQGPKTAQEVSAATGASERGVRILLGGLTALELVVKSHDGKYTLPPDVSAFMVSSKPAYHGGLVLHMAKQLIPNWQTLDEIVKTGKPSASVNRQDGGAAFFESFVECLFPMNYPAACNLAADLKLADSSGPVTVLDIAAGSGVWGIALAQSSPNVTVTAVDWPNVLGVCERVATRFGLANRFSYVAGDLMDVDYGGPYDVATLGHILHTEGIERSKALLKRVFDSLKPGGTVAIAEFLVNDDRTGPPMPLIFAVNMLVNAEVGDTFSFNEIGSWLREIGYVDVRELPAPGPSPLILATRP